jgi:DNA-binding transcriptional regulator LsrR (DeoR family)
MYRKQEIIISSHRDGKSQHQIAHDLQISRKIARMYIEEHKKVLRSATMHINSPIR